MIDSDEIVAKVQRLAIHHGVRVLFAVESGSRGFGYESANSDYDVRFVYVRPASWYLSVRERRDVIEYKDSDKLDIVGWDLRKALYQMARGNPQLGEWLHSPIAYIETDYLDDMMDLNKTYFNTRTAIFHYLHMALGNYNRYIKDRDNPQHKKYIYVARPFLACMMIERLNKMPDMHIDTLVQDVGDECPDFVHTIIERKKAGDELGCGPPIPEFNAWIEGKRDHFMRVAATSAREKLCYDDLDQYFMFQVLNNEALESKPGSGNGG